MVVCATCPNCGKEVEVSEGLQSCRSCCGPFVAHIAYQPRVRIWRLERVTRKVGGIEWGVWLQGVPWDMGKLLQEYWPGDDYVDVLGMDGYSGGHCAWQPFVQLFGPTYDEIVELGVGLNVIICETGCAGKDEDKAQWLRYALANAQARFPDLQGLVFYNRDCRPLGQGDWRIESGPESMLALQSGLAMPVFVDAPSM